MTTDEMVEHVRVLHSPTYERDFIAIPARNVKVCAECFSGNDDFHVTWPCAAALTEIGMGLRPIEEDRRPAWLRRSTAKDLTAA